MLTNDEDRPLTELGEGVWVKGIVETESGQPNVLSYKNSVKLPCLDGRKTWIGARSMSETKQIAFFESLLRRWFERLPHGRRH